MTAVKICGLTDPHMVRVAAEAGADWVGFVLYEKSPRNVLGQGGALEEYTDLVNFAFELGVESVALMVDPTERMVDKVLTTAVPNAIQLHGKETPEYVRRIWQMTFQTCEVWKAAGISNEDELEALHAFEVDRFLIDAKPAEGADLPGGNGEVGDWSLLEGFQHSVPWLLAGGLTPDNVAEAITATGAHAVDVSSGVERARGVKDEDLIRDFIDAAKSA
ncbi:MAG: phosphoribosylanthranilate isomerase [Pseudomonadota bacterium]